MKELTKKQQTKKELIEEAFKEEWVKGLMELPKKEIIQLYLISSIKVLKLQKRIKENIED